MLLQASILMSILVQPAPSIGNSAEPTEPAGQVVRLIEVGDHEVLPGVIRPKHEVTLSSSFDTLLGELRVEEGQHVSEGQILAVLDDRVVRAALKVAETQAERTAQIDHAEAVYEQAKDTLARIRAAYEQNAAAEAELVAAELDCEIAAADLRSAKESKREALASLELAQSRLEEHMVRAPFDGVVVRTHAEPGEMVAPGSPLIEIISDDGLCVDLYLPVSVADSVCVGDYYALKVEDPKPVVVAARVRYVEPRVDAVSRTIRVVFDVGPAEESSRVYAGVLSYPAARVPELDCQQLRAMATWAQFSDDGGGRASNQMLQGPTAFSWSAALGIEDVR